jgi:hypothetical protein
MCITFKRLNFITFKLFIALNAQLLIMFKFRITVNNIYYFDLSPGPYLVKNQIKHKRNFQNTDRC